MKQYMMIFSEDIKNKLALVFGGVEFLEVVGMQTNQQGKDYSIVMTPVISPISDVNVECDKQVEESIPEAAVE